MGDVGWLIADVGLFMALSRFRASAVDVAIAAVGRPRGLISWNFLGLAPEARELLSINLA
jgi:hypothetical protein